MSKVKTFYDPKIEFDKLLPENFYTLTQLVSVTDYNRSGKIILVDKEDLLEPPKIVISNLVIFSNEYSGVNNHVLINFVNFMEKNYIVENTIFIQNPPKNLFEQLKRSGFELEEAIYHNYEDVTFEQIIKLYDDFSYNIVGQNHVKENLFSQLFYWYRFKP